MGPKKGKGKEKGKAKKDEGPQGPTPAELLAQIALINAARDKETQERNLMMLERVSLVLFAIHSLLNLYNTNTFLMNVFHAEFKFQLLFATWENSFSFYVSYVSGIFVRTFCC